MKNSLKLAIPILFLFLISCNGKDKRLKEIEKIKKEVYSPDDKSQVFDAAKAERLMTLYSEYIDKYAEDSTAKQITFDAGEMAMNLGKADEALKFLNLFLEKYPEDALSDDAMFMKGFVYGEMKKDINQAREVYTEFLKKYPKSEMADEVAFLYMSLGKSDAQLIEELEAKNRALTGDTAKPIQ